MLRKSFIQIVYMTLISLSLWACGGSAPQAETGQATEAETLQQQLDQIERPHFIPWQDDLQDSVDLFEFQCDDCPPSFGQLISQTPLPQDIIQSGNCQGSLIGEDHFLTSRHCIPEDLLIKNVSCSGRVQILFPSINSITRAESISCDKIVDFAISDPEMDINTPQPDWIILKLKSKMEHRISETQNSGIKDDQELFAFLPLTDPVTNTIRTRKIKCKAIQGSLDFPSFQEDKSPMIYLKCNKKMTKGFSGTVLYTENSAQGKAVATISHIFHRRRNSQPVHISKKIIASNISCILLPEGSEKPDYCKFEKNEASQIRNDMWLKRFKKLKKRIDKKFKKWLEDNPSPVKWEVLTLDNLNEAPKTYQKFFKQLQEVGFQNLKGKKVNRFSQIIVPAFVKCLKDTNQETLTLPVVELKFNYENHGRPKAEMNILNIKGQIHKNSETEYVLNRKQDLPTMPSPDKYIFKGYFTHSSYIPPCQE